MFEFRAIGAGYPSQLSIGSSRATQPIDRIFGRKQYLWVRYIFLSKQSTHLSLNFSSTEEKSRSLRSFRKGRLRVSIVNKRQFLPFDNNGTNFCGIPREQQLQCFEAGDGRVNEQTELTVMHTIWMREHNRVAELLSQLNPGWNDEILYQESRRIVCAQLQHIIYNEFLPIIIGRNAMKKFSLFLTREGYSSSYSPDINVGITSSFATAAFRLHTLIEGNIKLLNENNRVVERLELKNQFNNPQILYKQKALDLMVNGLTGQPIQHGLY